jgi:ferredoxin
MTEAIDIVPGRLAGNPKPEIRNPKETRSSKSETAEQATTCGAFCGVSDFELRISNLLRTSSFGFRISALALFFCSLLASPAFAEQRFPPPDFESGHQLPITTTPPPRALALEYLDVGILVATLAIAVWLIYKPRSRRGLLWLSIFSLAYFGFYRKGCICPIGAPQNIAYGLFNDGYVVPLTVIAFFAVPLVVALFAGRAFCGGVCPHGALQDLLLVKPVKVPPALEHGLGLIPFLFLGAGLIYAATGTGFFICRYDPFVPLFRRSGSFFILSVGAVFLLSGLFVGRPYCRFLCPYGALLKLASLVSKWRVRVTPDYCTQCRLCEHACPFGAMREPSAGAPRPQFLGIERRRLGWLLLLLPALIAMGAVLGAKLAVPASRLHPTVELAERHVRQQQQPVHYGAQTPEALSLQRAEQDPQAILAAAKNLRHRFALACLIFGGWVGLVVGVKLIALSVRPSRTDWEPDRGACLACARCFLSCPNERVRLGLMPASELPTGPPPVPAGMAAK